MNFPKILLFLIIAVNSFAQKPVSIPVDEVYYSDHPFLNIVLEKAEGGDHCFKASYSHSGASLCFNSDGTFVFYYVDMNSYEMSVGKFTRKEGIYMIASDSLATAKAVSDPEFYTKYFRFKTPTALNIEKVAYTLEGDALVPFCNTFAKDKIELLYTSHDFSRRKMRMSLYKGIQYDASGKSVTVDYDGKTTSSIPLDSLWGFATFKAGTLKVFRTTPRGFNWYNYPGIQVMQTDPFVIYAIGEGRLYTYFSKDLNSKIYPLDASKLKMVFHDKPRFIESFTKEIPAHRPLSGRGKTTNSYRILEIYKETEALKPSGK